MDFVPLGKATEHMLETPYQRMDSCGIALLRYASVYGSATSMVKQYGCVERITSRSNVDPNRVDLKTPSN
jgi:hypothetical protein